MGLAFSVIIATDTHSTNAMIIAVGNIRALNVTLDLHYCSVKDSRVSKLINFVYDTRSYATFYVFTAV